MNSNTADTENPRPHRTDGENRLTISAPCRRGPRRTAALAPIKRPQQLHYLQSFTKGPGRPAGLPLGQHNGPLLWTQPPGSPHPNPCWPAAMSFAELRTRNNAGEEVSFEAFAGKVVLAVNVARL